VELRARVSELDELQRQQQTLLALKDEELAARPAGRAGVWPWLAGAFAVLMPVAWWMGRRGGGPAPSRAGGHGVADVSVARDGEVDGGEPMQAVEPGP